MTQEQIDKIEQNTGLIITALRAYGSKIIEEKDDTDIVPELLNLITFFTQIYDAKFGDFDPLDPYRDEDDPRWSNLRNG